MDVLNSGAMLRAPMDTKSRRNLQMVVVGSIAWL